MPKLRNATTDIGGMAQYLARKCIIHSPQAELDIADATARQKAPRFGKSDIHKGSQVHMVNDRGATGEPNKFVAISPGGRGILVTLTEINPEEIEPELLGKVGS